jgi:hypothetical protein
LVASISQFGNAGQVRDFAQAHAYYEKFRSLNAIANTCSTLLDGGRWASTDERLGIVAFEIADYDGLGIEPERLRLFIETVVELNTNVTRLLGAESVSLRFTVFDSGSSLLVAAKIAKAVATFISDLMRTWWDKVMFHDFDTLDKKIQAVERANGYGDESEDSDRFWRS